MRNKIKSLFLVFATVVLMVGVPPSRALADTATATQPQGKPPVPGTELAKAISKITGVAISPLLGASAIGAWKYAETPPEARAKLPWYAQPWFWVPAFVIVGLCALKDTLGMAVPAPLKKPFDVLETAAHKISGLIAAGAFVPMMAAVFHEAGVNAPSLNAGMGAHGFVAAIDPSWLYNCISVPVMLAAYFVVFLASNAINILILLSPFPVVDASLKAFRLFVLSTVTVTAFANPWVGAAWSIIIIIISYFIAGWSFRLSHFGLTFVWDYLTFKRNRFKPHQTANWMFLSRKTEQVPVRTYGQLVRGAQGSLVFNYRPWLIFPRRILALPPGDYAVGKGFIYSEIVRIEGDRTRSVLLLPPCYRTHEVELAAIYEFAGVRDVGLRAAFAWLKDFLGFKAKRELAAA